MHHSNDKLREALEECMQKDNALIPSDKEIKKQYTPSEKFKKKMSVLIRHEKLKEKFMLIYGIRKKIYYVAGAAILILGIRIGMTAFITDRQSNDNASQIIKTESTSSSPDAKSDIMLEESALNESDSINTKDTATIDANSDAGTGAAGIESSQELSSSTSQVSGQKLIKDVSMSVETKTFDEFISELNKQIIELDGYVESSDVSGGSYLYESDRSGYLVARIPAEQLEGFVTTVKEKGNVVHISEQTTDVTLQYVDLESHLKALRLEQETLLGLLENATKMEDVIAIQSQLTQVRYEIESNESQVRTYDNLVNYSTVRIDITEVDRETPAETKSFAGEIKIKLSNNLYAIKEGFRSLMIELIAAFPYLIIWAVVITLVIILGKKGYKKYFNKQKTNTNIRQNNASEKETDSNEHDENN